MSAASAALCLAICPTLWDTARAQSGARATGDTALQQAVTRAMAGRSGAAVVVDVHSGKVLAAYRLDVAARRLAKPGSSLKPFTLLALLEAGKVNSQTNLLCQRRLTLGGHNLDCAHPVTTQPLDPATALAYSCNSYFTNVATRLAPKQLRDALLRDGFSSPSGLTTDEVAGTVTLAKTQQQLQLQAIGEWGIEITPLELLRGYRNLAQLSQAGNGEKLAPLFDGLAASTDYGWGHLAQPPSAVKVAGKTGTASTSEGRWTNAWFAGYAPAANPEIVLVVFLERGHGGSDAAKQAGEIFAAYAASRTTNGHQSSAGAAQ
ncbi:MAG TPA: penicillin-binding transpeptidase domain-containing protein [Terriglobales bacterium]